MNSSRRSFLRLGAAVLGGATSSRSRVSADPAPPSQAAPAGAGLPPTNWAGNRRYGVDRIHEARTLDEVRETVRDRARLKALGSRHCFNGIADSDRYILSLRPMADVVDLDSQARTVTVEAGVTYGQLCPYLHERGFALHNLASLPHISVAGACATATHGSGVGSRNLASAVSGLELVTAGGHVLRLSREKDGRRFPGAVVHLGALGVVTKVTLDVEPTYLMRQRVYLDLPTSALRDHFDEVVSGGYSVSLFTDWRSDRINEVWVKSRIDAGPDPGPTADFFGARPAEKNVHPIVALSAEHCTEQMGVVGPWYERLPHFRMGFTPSSGKELQSEYFVPRRHAQEAIGAIARLHELVSPHLMISELRTVAADDLWMSTCYGRDSLAIHFTWEQDWPSVRKVLPVIERELSPYGARPHWGKLFTVERATLRSRYERIGEFEDLARELDPGGKFRNAFLEEALFG